MAQTEQTSIDRLLLVDDNPTNLQVLFQALEAEGYELLVAQSGEEAIATAKEAKPQLILLDINPFSGALSSPLLRESISIVSR